MKWKVSQTDSTNLYNGIASALHDALVKTEQSEPQLVANLVWHLPKSINNIKFPRGYSIKSGGVFIHGQPQVKWQICEKNKPNSDVSVEIGDLLLIRTGVEKDKVYDRRAMLLQAKKTDSMPAVPDNKNQHDLYAKWPVFQYVRSTPALNGKQRHIVGQDLYNSSKYLLLQKKHCATCAATSTVLSPLFCSPDFCVLTAQPTLPLLSHYKCFYQELFDFVVGDSGKQFEKPGRGTRGWDRVITDMLGITAKRTSKFIEKASANASKTRGQGTEHFTSGVFNKFTALFENGLPIEKIPDISKAPPELTIDAVPDPEKNGISVIEFVVDIRPLRI